MSKNTKDLGDFIFVLVIGVIICALLGAMF